VFYIEVLDITIQLGQIIDFLATETKNEMITRFISWREFSNYFRVLSKKLLEFCSKKDVHDAVLDINPKYIRILKDVFDTVPREINGRESNYRLFNFKTLCVETIF